MDIYVLECNMNDGGSPTSTIDSLLGETRRRTNTSNIANSDRDNDVGEQPLIGSRVAVDRGSVTHFGTIFSSAIVEERKHYEIVYNDTSTEEVDSLESSRLQELYINQIDNDTVGQQKQRTRSTPNDEYVGTRVSFSCSGVAFYGTVKRCFLGD